MKRHVLPATWRGEARFLGASARSCPNLHWTPVRYWDAPHIGHLTKMLESLPKKRQATCHPPLTPPPS